jgi:FKBP-type peptidyl-prolyl cis-trans isomerase
LIIAFLSLIAFSCEKESQSEKDEQEIQNYLSSNSLTAEKHSSGMYYIIEDEGYGNHPSIYASVKILYKGMLTDGTVFDETEADTPIWLDLISVIEGWQIGIPLFKKGGKGILLIPSALGYGSKSQGDIPANSVLIFEIELVDIDEPF